MTDKVKSRKSWREKLENSPESLPKAVEVPASWEKRIGDRRMLVPTPLHVDAQNKIEILSTKS